MNEESLGKLFKNGDLVYKCIAYSDTPTITMQNIETGEKINMCVNSLLATCFEEVIEENKKIEKITKRTNKVLKRELISKINELIDEVNKLKKEVK